MQAAVPAPAQAGDYTTAPAWVATTVTATLMNMSLLTAEPEIMGKNYPDLANPLWVGMC